MEVVSIEGIHPKVMERLIEFAYTASISVGEKCVLHVMNGAVMYPCAADFHDIELAGQARRKHLVRQLALHDSPYGFVDLRHTTGGHKRHGLDGPVASNGHCHERMRVRPLRRFANHLESHVQFDLSGPGFRVTDELLIGVGSSEQPASSSAERRRGP